MIYPIRAYGDPVLRAHCQEIQSLDDEVKQLISNMFETMDSSDGVGLAAPQIGQSLRLFVIDSTHFKEDEGGVRQAFINPKMIDETGELWDFEEGCLSIPQIREDVSRPSNISLEYTKEDGSTVTEKFSGLTARVIQHEYDHIEGILFLDHLTAFKRRLLKGKLTNISKGKVDVRYRMKFPKNR